MLDDDQAGRRFEDLGRFCHWARVEVRAGNDHLARHLRHDRRSRRHVGRASLIGRRRRGCWRRCRCLWSDSAFLVASAEAWRKP